MPAPFLCPDFLCPEVLLTVIGGYLVGSIPFGLIIARFYGVDIRQVGSGNIGATNVRRSLGNRAGALTFLLDTLKGACAVMFVPLLVGLVLGSNPDAPTLVTQLSPISGVAVLIGHCYTFALKFNGGKGVATGLGVFLALAHTEALIALCCFVATLWAFRYVSLASISAAVIFAVLLVADYPTHQSVSLCIAGIASSSIILLRHKANIQRLIGGTEHKVGQK